MKQKRIYTAPKSEFTLLIAEDIITSSQGDVLFNAEDLEA